MILETFNSIKGTQWPGKPKSQAFLVPMMLQAIKHQNDGGKHEKGQTTRTHGDIRWNLWQIDYIQTLGLGGRRTSFADGFFLPFFCSCLITHCELDRWASQCKCDWLKLMQKHQPFGVEWHLNNYDDRSIWLLWHFQSLQSKNHESGKSSYYSLIKVTRGVTLNWELEMKWMNGWNTQIEHML